MKLDGTWKLGTPIHTRKPSSIEERTGLYPSNRIRIALDFEQTDTESLVSLKDVVISIIPARFVPVIKYWVRGSLSVWNLSGELRIPDNTLAISGSAIMLGNAFITYGNDDI